MYKHLFPCTGRAISVGEGCRGSLLDDKVSATGLRMLPSPESHPSLSLDTRMNWRAVHGACVHTPHYQATPGPTGLVHFSLGPILQCLVRLSLLFLCCFLSASPWTSFLAVFHVRTILQKNTRQHNTPASVFWLMKWESWKPCSSAYLKGINLFRTMILNPIQKGQEGKILWFDV